MKRRRIRIAVVVLVACALLASGVLMAIHWALRQVRPFYEQALAVQPAVLEDNRRELESRAAALYSDVKNQGQWNALLTDDQINGWLAVQLRQEHADILPEDIKNPRLMIRPEGIVLGFESERAGVSTVVTVDIEAFLADSQSIGVRLVGVHAGVLPLPAKKIAEELTEASRSLLQAIRWTRMDGDPVAVLDFAAQWPDKAGHVHLDALELHDGEIYLAGHAQSPPVPGEVAATQVIDQDSVAEDQETDQ